jgi:hypothetical protein
MRSSSSTIGCGSSAGGVDTNLLLRLKNPIARVFAWPPAFPAKARNC